LVGQVEERVGDLRREIRKAAFVELEELDVDPDLEPPLQTWIVSSCLWCTCSVGPPCGATSTLPPRISRSLRLDLPRNIAALGLPVTGAAAERRDHVLGGLAKLAGALAPLHTTSTTC
jgi:hypothetical protein